MHPVGVHLGQHVNLLVLFVKQVLQLSVLPLEHSHSLLQRLGVPARKGPPAQLVAGAALEADGGALRAGRAGAVAADLLAATAIAGLGDAALGAGPDLDDFHWEYPRHGGRVCLDCCDYRGSFVAEPLPVFVWFAQAEEEDGNAVNYTSP